MIQHFFKVLFVIFIITAQSEGAKRKFRRGFNLHHLEPPEKPQGSGITKDEWFEQRLDHFNAQNTRTWKQRFFSRYTSIIMNSNLRSYNQLS